MSKVLSILGLTRLLDCWKNPECRGEIKDVISTYAQIGGGTFAILSIIITVIGGCSLAMNLVGQNMPPTATAISAINGLVVTQNTITTTPNLSVVQVTSTPTPTPMASPTETPPPVPASTVTPVPTVSPTETLTSTPVVTPTLDVGQQCASLVQFASPGNSNFDFAYWKNHCVSHFKKTVTFNGAEVTVVGVPYCLESDTGSCRLYMVTESLIEDHGDVQSQGVSNPWVYITYFEARDFCGRDEEGILNKDVLKFAFEEDVDEWSGLQTNELFEWSREDDETVVQMHPTKTPIPISLKGYSRAKDTNTGFRCVLSTIYPQTD